jgi:hypothetical protein
VDGCKERLFWSLAIDGEIVDQIVSEGGIVVGSDLLDCSVPNSDSIPFCFEVC